MIIPVFGRIYGNIEGLLNTWQHIQKLTGTCYTSVLQLGDMGYVKEKTRLDEMQKREPPSHTLQRSHDALIHIDASQRGNAKNERERGDRPEQRIGFGKIASISQHEYHIQDRHNFNQRPKNNHLPEMKRRKEVFENNEGNQRARVDAPAKYFCEHY